jgi:hypothetical protein
MASAVLRELLQGKAITMILHLLISSTSRKLQAQRGRLGSHYRIALWKAFRDFLRLQGPTDGDPVFLRRKAPWVNNHARPLL